VRWADESEQPIRTACLAVTFHSRDASWEGTWRSECRKRSNFVDDFIRGIRDQTLGARPIVDEAEVALIGAT